MRDKPIGGVEVVMTVRVKSTDGTTITEVTETVSETGGNPAFVGRATSRASEEATDRIREMLRPRYGDVEFPT
jgi:hypothetical protein